MQPVAGQLILAHALSEHLVQERARKLWQLQGPTQASLHSVRVQYRCNCRYT